MPLQLLGPNIRLIVKASLEEDTIIPVPEGIVSGRTQKWKRVLLYDFKILLVVVILTQAFHTPIIIF